MYDEEFFPPSRPRAVKGGIKAQSKRGDIGQSWWAKRWIETLESFRMGARLNRGRSYARKGQVLDIEIEPGEVFARVQGSRPRPYGVTINIKPLSAKDWDKLAKAFNRQAIYSAKLLAGEMPPDIESVFEAAKLSLFPKQAKDLQTECSCPDWSNPCKHVAAVYYLLGEEFDRDPFLIFKLRGLDRGALLEKLNTGPSRSAKSTPSSTPLPEEFSEFWKDAQLPPDFFGEALTPPVHAALPKRLGSFPFWRGSSNFQDVMEEFYKRTDAHRES